MLGNYCFLIEAKDAAFLNSHFGTTLSMVCKYNWASTFSETPLKYGACIMYRVQKNRGRNKAVPPVLFTCP